jgi:hypothetical protein
MGAYQWCAHRAVAPDGSTARSATPEP